VTSAGSPVTANSSQRPARSRRRLGSRPVLAALRAVAVAHAIGIFAQPVLAGMFLTGRYDMLEVHAFNAIVVLSSGLAQLICATALWAVGGLRWPAWGSLVLLLGETAQFELGQAAALDLHLPLGVALVAGTTVFLVELWHPSPVGGGRATRRE
jgi:hypothetical protein